MQEELDSEQKRTKQGESPEGFFPKPEHYTITTPTPSPELAEKINESINAIVNSFTFPNGALSAMLESIQSFYSSYAPIAEALREMQQRFNESIKPIMANLAALYADIDWERLAEGSRKWGEYGWIPPERMGLRQICNPPETLLGADKVALSYLDRDSISDLENRLIQMVPKKTDMKEAIDLFNEHRYKPAAMMICSLIECELIKAQDRAEWRKPEKAIKRFNSEIPEEGLVLVTESALISAYRYYFSNAKNFNHSFEGELNRNFLQHGMMYKPVRRKTCIKLLLILQEIAMKTCV